MIGHNGAPHPSKHAKENRERRQGVLIPKEKKIAKRTKYMLSLAQEGEERAGKLLRGACLGLHILSRHVFRVLKM